MNIRKMTAEDHAAVYRLWSETPGMGLRESDDGAEGFCRFLRRNPETSFVAERDGNLVGCIMVGHDGRRAHIYHTAVAASERCRGVGGALVEAALAALRREGIDKASLVAFADNAVGNGFWENRGFRARGDLVYRDKIL